MNGAGNACGIWAGQCLLGSLYTLHVLPASSLRGECQPGEGVGTCGLVNGKSSLAMRPAHLLPAPQALPVTASPKLDSRPTLASLSDFTGGSNWGGGCDLGEPADILKP